MVLGATRAVGDHHVGRLVSAQQALGAVASPVGAALGGVLVELRGDAVVFLLDAATYAVLFGAGLAVRTRVAGIVDATADGVVAADAGTAGGAVRRTVAFLPRAGLAVVRADRVPWCWSARCCRSTS